MGGNALTRQVEEREVSDPHEAKVWSEVRVDLIRWLRSRAAEHDRIAGLGGQDDAEIQRLLAEMGVPTYAQQAVAERALAEQVEALTLPGNLTPVVDRDAEELEALHLDICMTFGAVESPSPDQLEAMLLKRGWVPREEVAQAIEAEGAEDDRDEGDDFHRSIHFATCAQIARSVK
jgi:hypothetical protein